MNIWLASTAPGNEKSMRKKGFVVPIRLLSYYHIKEATLETESVFKNILEVIDEQRRINKSSTKHPSRTR